MKVGVAIPQGWTGEYDGWEPARAWARSVQLAQEAEGLGFESIWVFDHFHTVPVPTDEITFESFCHPHGTRYRDGASEDWPRRDLRRVS